MITPINYYLKPYNEKDSHLFPKRLTHGEEIKNRIRQYPFVVLYGPVGGGKTSLLQAQVIPELSQEGILIIRTRIFGNPEMDLKAALYKTTPDQITPVQANRPLIQIVDDFRPKNNILVILIDQVEELLNFYSENIVIKFFEQISRITNPRARPDQPLAHVVLSVRADFIHDLINYADKLHLIDPKAIYLLPHLDKNEIDIFVSMFTNQTGLILQKSLVEQIKKDVKKFGLRTIDTRIVLYKLALDHKTTSQINSQMQNNISLRRYQELGGSLKIIRGFLETEVETIKSSLIELDSQPARSRRNVLFSTPTSTRNNTYKKALRYILGLMVAKRDMPVSISLQAIHFQLLNSNIGLNEKLVNRLLAGLCANGLVSHLPFQESSFELTQGGLAQAIWRWLLPVPEEVQRIDEQDQIRVIIRDCKALRRLPNYDELFRISSFANDIGFNKSELALLFRSSLMHNLQSKEWYNRLKQEKIPTLAIINKEVSDIKYPDRKRLVISLYKIGEEVSDSLTVFLEDEYPQIRAAAIAALEKLDPTFKWHAALQKEQYIPGGNSLNGTNQGFFTDEGPEHSTSLPGFYISTTTITNQDYQMYAEEINIPFSFPLGMERHPVVNLTWYDVRDYARWGSYRLPSEAEWEKSASFELNDGKIAKRKYPWGNVFDETKCNMRASKLDGTTRVGAYSKLGGDSYVGCADMAGNVWEWTNSLYRPYPYQDNDGREDPSEVGSRVIRGGSFKSGATYVTCTVRQPFDGYSKRDDVGFRCVLDLPDINEW